MVDEEIQQRNTNPIVKLVVYLTRTLKKLFQPKKKLVGESWQEVKLDISVVVTRYLEMRHVLEDEIKQVIFHAETSGEKLFQPDTGKFLAKLRIGQATFYVEYSQGTRSFTVESAYAHKSEIVG